MSKVVKNLTDDTVNYGGVRILTGATYPISDNMELSGFQNDGIFLGALCANPAEAAIFEDSTPGILLVGSSAVQFLFDSKPFNTDQRPIVHATPRKIGTYTYYTCCGDDPSDANKVGGEIIKSRMLTFFSAAANNEPVVKEIVFNSINNETFIFQGIAEYINARNDYLTMRIVTLGSTYVPDQSGTDYELDPDTGLFLPAEGIGTYQIDNPVLVEMPNNEHGTRAPGFWDADFNSLTGDFENITPNLTAEGRFNIFVGEFTVHRFGYALAVLGDGNKAFPSSDNSQLGHNMKFIFEAHTNTDPLEGGSSHEWMANITLTLYRKRTT